MLGINFYFYYVLVKKGQVRAKECSRTELEYRYRPACGFPFFLFTKLFPLFHHQNLQIIWFFQHLSFHTVQDGRRAREIYIYALEIFWYFHKPTRIAMHFNFLSPSF